MDVLLEKRLKVLLINLPIYLHLFWVQCPNSRPLIDRSTGPHLLINVLLFRYNGAAGSNDFEVGAAYGLQEWQGPQFPQTGILRGRCLFW